MEIILKQDVANLGHKDDIVKVKDGYANNFLIPQGMAVMATASAKKMHTENMKQRAHKEEKLRADAQSFASKITASAFKVGAKVSSTGKIFGSVNTIMLAEALKNAGFEVDRKNIKIKEEDVKEVGMYHASVKLYKDIKVEIEFEVVAE
ncbi:MAG: 50S ribosomal protein L9 [Bacteroidales bacterium]|nr:50S ribosomal protein L9 [Bacteroidales bacterium]HQL70566.1 50S ribosomal protein L9 [Bacteroidales bacterium]